VIWVMMSLLGLTLIALAGVGLLYGERQRQTRLEEKADHARCIAHLASVSSNRFLAARLRDLAQRYDSVEEAATFAELARTRFNPDGSSMPALWLTLQAERLEPMTVDFNEVNL
jgi:hypothetical protein